ncbi:1756_t:CDS:2, partial [Paraglomus brasilianum]
ESLDEYFETTAPEKYRFLDYYKDRKNQDDFTNNFRLEARRLYKCLNYLVENGSQKMNMTRINMIKKSESTSITSVNELPEIGALSTELKDHRNNFADVQQTTESYENRGEKQRILPQCENSGSPWFPIFAGMFSENSGSFPAIKTADDAEGTTNFSTKSYKK